MAEGSASFVLAALGGSTYRKEYGRGGPPPPPSLRPRWDGLLDHPAGCSDAVPDLLEWCVVKVPKWFFNNLLDKRPA